MMLHALILLLLTNNPKVEVIKTATLENTPACKITATVFIENYGLDIGFCKVRFRTMKHGKVTQRDIVVRNDGKSDRSIVQAGDFTSNGSRDLLVSFSWGGTTNVMYGVRSHEVVALYKHERAREWAQMVKSSGKWKLVEYSREQDWDENMGIGYRTKDKSLKRYLHWNGHEFILDRPGSSRIINAY